MLNSLLFGQFYHSKLEDWTASSKYYDYYPWIFDAQPIQFELQNTLLPKEKLEDKFIKIQQKGASFDHRSLEELYFEILENDENTQINEKSIDCEHLAEYTFNRKKYSLQRIEATFQNFIIDNIEKEIFLLERISENSYI